METAHSGFVQPQRVLKCTICDQERPAQSPLPVDSNHTSNLYS